MKRLILIALFLFLVSCNKEAAAPTLVPPPLNTPLPAATALPTATDIAPTAIVAATATPAPIDTPVSTATATTIPPTAIPPTAVPPTSVPTATSIPCGPAPIVFAPGTTSAVTSCTVPAHGRHTYTLIAHMGQQMNVIVTSTDPSALLEIIDEDGIPIKRYVDGVTTWSGELRITGTYYISVPSFSDSDADYSLTVSIDPIPAWAIPTPLVFAAGAISSDLSSHILPGQRHFYSLDAAEGQVVYASLAATVGFPVLVIMDADGRVLGEHLYTVAMELPATATYLLMVDNRDGFETDYNFSVAAITPDAATETTRITFASGATSAIIADTLHIEPENTAIMRYVLAAGPSQNLHITVTSLAPPAPLLMTIRASDGTLLLAVNDVPVGSPVIVGLPTAQDYIISFAGNAGVAADIAISFEVEIP